MSTQIMSTQQLSTQQTAKKASVNANANLRQTAEPREHQDTMLNRLRNKLLGKQLIIKKDTESQEKGSIEGIEQDEDQSTFFTDGIETIPIPFDVPAELFKNIIDGEVGADGNPIQFETTMLRPNIYFENLLIALNILKNTQKGVKSIPNDLYEKLGNDTFGDGRSLATDFEPTIIQNFEYRNCKIQIDQNFKKRHLYLSKALETVNQSQSTADTEKIEIYAGALLVNSYLGPYKLVYSDGSVIVDFEIDGDNQAKFTQIQKDSKSLKTYGGLETYGGSTKTKAYRPRRQRKSRRRVVKRKIPKSKT